jgi:hypothetical protein
VSENRVLRKIFGLERDEQIRGWKNCLMRGFKTCALCYLYTSSDQFKNNEMSRACSMNGLTRNAQEILTGMPEGKRPL